MSFLYYSRFFGANLARQNLDALKSWNFEKKACFGWRIRAIFTISSLGGIAQLVERLPCTQEVSGSTPLTSTKCLLLSPHSFRLFSPDGRCGPVSAPFFYDG